MLMKILSGAHVEQDLSLDKFEGIVSHITANDYLTFTKEEILVKGRGHNKALHISMKCMDYVLARVLIDNGSSLNVMPKATLDKLSCERAHNKLLIIFGEEDFLVSEPMTSRYVEATEEALETFFQAFEIVNTSYVEYFQITPYLSNASLKMVKTMMREGYRFGKGLGKDGK